MDFNVRQIRFRDPTSGQETETTMLGEAKKNGQVIVDYTTTENLESLTINTDINGNPFELIIAKIMCEIPASTTGTADYIKARFCGKDLEDNDVLIQLPTLKMPVSNRALMVYNFYSFGGVYFVTANVSQAFTLTSSDTSSMCTDKMFKFFDKFELLQYSSSSTLIPAGTRILIHGVRA